MQKPVCNNHLLSAGSSDMVVVSYALMKAVMADCLLIRNTSFISIA
jgi:predicted MarR family transcription regulator